MTWVALVALLILSVVIVLYLRQGMTKPPANPSVFVDLDDQPPTEIDFDAGIRANQKMIKPKDKP